MIMMVNSTSHNNLIETNHDMSPAGYRLSLLTSISVVLGTISILAGSIILLNRGLHPTAQTDSALPGILCLLIGLICISIYFALDFIGYQLSSGIIVISILSMGGYLLFTPWLISGVLLLLTAVLVSVMLFSLQISILVFMIAQTLVVGSMTMVGFGLSSIEPPTSWMGLLFQTGILMMTFYLLTVIILNSAGNALKKQAELKKELEIERQVLRQKVDQHTRSLNITGEVNRLISTILDSNRLVGDVVEQIRQAFNYYHVQIYFLQPEENMLKLVGATGEAGTALLIGQHQIAPDVGLVGQAATTALPVVTQNVQESADWIPNSLLPDTVAEIAVPIIWENKVLGVLDVQHNKPLDLPQNGINILQTIAIQLGTAINNVNIFQQAEEQLQRDSVLNDLSLKLQVAPDIQSSMQLVGKHIAQVLEPVSIKIEIDPTLLNTNRGLEN